MPNKMNTIRRYITQVVGEDEDQMEIDHNFTERYLTQFPTIDRETIEVMVENGYQTRETLLAFDLREDLPLLPVLNMAQKSLLRKALTQLHENQDLETKVNDIKGNDEELNYNSFVANTSALKRKRESTARYSPPKRSKTNELITDLDTTYTSPIAIGDGLGTRMRQMISGRKSIRSQTNRSDFESDFETEVNPNRFQFNSRTRSGLNRTNTSINTDIDSYEEDEDEEVEDEEVVEREVKRGRPTKAMATKQTVISAQTRVIPNRNSLNANNNSLINSRTTRTQNPRLSTTPSIAIKSENSSPVVAKQYVPTPTELEVRERLAQKKALGKQKSGRKRRL